MRTILLLLQYYGWVYLLFLTRMSIAERNISINPQKSNVKLKSI